MSIQNICQRICRRLLIPLCASVLALGVAGQLAAATITIQNNDPAGVGFNDPAPRATVGGNSGTTLGAQRLIAFQSAASIWGATLTSAVTIVIRAQWTALTCTSGSAVLGSAGANIIHRDFAGAPFTGTWYNEALAGKLQGADPGPADFEINANFNVNLGNAGCLDGTFFYLGLDNNHGSNIDLVTVLLHEFGHGLGFQTFTSGSTGALNSGFPTVYDRFLMDLTSGKSWLQMSNAERAASAINPNNLVWDGPRVLTDRPTVLTGGGFDSFGKPRLFSPNPLQGGSSVSHWDVSATPNQLMEPAINFDLTHNVVTPSDLSFSQMRDIGWLASTLPTAISKTTGDSQTTIVNQPFAVIHSVTETPATTGITVSWTINPNVGGASAFFPSTGSRFAVSTTNALGVATAPAVTANGVAGAYSMNATVPGAGTTTFTLTNIATPVSGPACVLDTSQSDFQAGVHSLTSATINPDNVVLFGGTNVLDQQSTTLGGSGNGITTTSWSGQTFTPTVTGQLTSADINLFCSGCSGATPNLTLSLRATSGGVPTGADLATATIAGFNNGGVASYFMGTFASPPTLTAGTQYALVIRPTAIPGVGTYAVTRSGDATTGADVYAGGTRVISGSSGAAWSIPLVGGVSTDTGFRIFMTGSVPAGNFTSSVKDANPPVSDVVSWTTLSWNATVPANTALSFQAAASNNVAGPFNFVGPDGTAGTFFNSGGSLGQFNGNRYLRYRTYLNSTTSATPTLADATVCYNNALPIPDLSITKTDGVTTAVPGGSVTYTITASNAVGPGTATGATVADTFPASLTCNWTCAGSGGGTCPASGSGNISAAVTLPMASSVVFTANCAISAGATGSLANTATITFAGDPVSANNSATDTDTLTPTANLSITKTDGVTTIIPGNAVSYTIIASNAGPSHAPGTTVADTFPVSLLNCTWTCSGAGGGTCAASGSGSINDNTVILPSGGSVTYLAGCTINPFTTGNLVNTATVTAGSGITDAPGNNSATDTDTLTPQANLSITKTDGATTEIPGTPIAYTITASNPGPSNVPGATVADTFPATLLGCTWTCTGAGSPGVGTCAASGNGNINDSTVNLPPNSSVTYVANCNIAPSATGTLSNTASVTPPGSVTDPTPGNNSANDTDTLTREANLGITKSDGVTTMTPGGSVSYTITASNPGPSNVSGNTVADTFPAGLTCGWTCAGANGGTCAANGVGNISDSTVNLPTGGSVTYTANCMVAANATGSIANTATVTIGAGVTETTPGNNSATDTDTVTLTADLGITKTDGVATAVAGGAVTYTIVASNAGPSSITGATVADTFPGTATCTWTCAGAGGGTCAASGIGNINQSVNLPNGGSTTFTASCTIAASATGSLANTATVTAPGGVTDAAGNNSATDTDTLTQTADLAITKSDGVTSAVPGGAVTYTIVASNAGPSSITGATVADTFPGTATCTWTCAGAGGGSCTASGSGNINQSVNLPAGGSTTFTASCTIAASATGSLANTATVTAPGGVIDAAGNNSATDTDTLTQTADLAITKTDGVTSAVPGGSVTYTIVASNAGPSSITGATVADTFSGTLTCTWTCAGAGGGSCTASGSGNINQSVNLPAGGSTTFTASCTIAANATGSLANTATVTAPGGVTDAAGNNSATDTDTLTQTADLAITKSDGVTSAVPGGSVTYTIVASNAGPSSITGATVADTFPGTLTCTWTCAGAGGGTCTASGSGNINQSVNLPAGGSTTFTASCTIAASATGSLANTATVTAPGGVTDAAGNNSATDTDTLTPQANLGITKTDGVTTATPGGSVTYTIVASNPAGSSNAPGSTVADTFPAGLTCTWTCVGAGGGTCTASGSGNINQTVNLPAGSSTSFTASCSIAASATGTIANTATVTPPGTVIDGTPGNNSATDTDTLAVSTDLSITKTDGVTAATPGGSVTYTITAANAGPSTATGASVADTFPATETCNWTCAGASGGTCPASGSGNINNTVMLPVGGSVVYTASCAISAGATGSLSNTATVAAAAGTTDPVPGNNSATDIDALGAQADLAITKTDGVTTATPGGSVTYTIVASNPAGSSNAPGSTVADTFPAGLTCTWTCAGAGGGTCTASGSGNINQTVNLPAGSSTSFTASCSIAASATGTIANTATVTAPVTVTDPTPGNNSATDTDTLAVSTDLSITKTDGVTAATPGGSVTYTITAANAGPSNATGATVADTFPATETCNWTCAGASGGTCPASGSGNINNTVLLPVGGSVVYTASCAISAGATGSLSNTATVAAAAGTTDPVPGNNSATDIDALGAQADLAITKTDGVTTATPGGSVTYTIAASNPAGSSNAPGSTVADTFPAGLTCTWTCTGAGGGACTASGSGNINQTVNLPAGGSTTFTASCTIAAAATGSVANTATVAAPAGVTDSAQGNNSATDTDTLTASSDLAITKTDGVAAVVAGSSLTYTIAATNAGPSNASGATVADTFPASETCTWTCAGAGGESCVASGSGNISDTVSLPVGGSVVYTASCTLSAAATGNVANTATVAVAAGGGDPNPGNNSATDDDQIVSIDLFANGFEGAAQIALLWMDASKSGVLQDSGLLHLAVGSDGSGLFAIADAYSPLVWMHAADGSRAAEIQGRRNLDWLEVRLVAIGVDGERTVSGWIPVPTDVELWTLEVSGATAPGAADGRLVLSMDGAARLTLNGLSMPRQPLASALIFGTGSAHVVPLDTR